MGDSLSSSIERVLMESRDADLSGRYALFAIYADNRAMLHIIEDRETYEAMKHRFTSNDGIKRLGASQLPENTTFKKLSESLEHKFRVPKETFSVRHHQREQKPEQREPKVVNEMQRHPPKPQNGPKKGSVLESVLKGRERFTDAPRTPMPQNEEPRKEPSINSFRPATSQRIDLSKFNNGDKPMI